MDDNAFDELVEGIASELNVKLIAELGSKAVSAVRVAGYIYLEAVASSVPAELAKEMAADFWAKSMGIPFATGAVQQPAGGDDD
ncbi:hypothetical protein [Streptomyces buecherae]|uniref:hypothetical protein n=1 Tax=Streptomyces buecherae TaxID=2763006 RepID=UPI0037932E1B